MCLGVGVHDREREGSSQREFERMCMCIMHVDANICAHVPDSFLHLSVDQPMDCGTTAQSIIQVLFFSLGTCCCSYSDLSVVSLKSPSDLRI